MRTSILNTEFNFAKSINLSLIAAPDAYPSYPSTLTQMIALWNSHPKSLIQRKLNPILPSTSSI